MPAVNGSESQVPNSQVPNSQVPNSQVPNSQFSGSARELILQNEKATRQLGQPFLSRENSSNGGFIHRNFLRESYES
jgi:hypothetical protein